MCTCVPRREPWLFQFDASLVERSWATSGKRTSACFKPSIQKGELPSFTVCTFSCKISNLLSSPCLCSDALDALGLKRYCCRRMLLAHVDLIEKLLNYAPLEKWCFHFHRKRKTINGLTRVVTPLTACCYSNSDDGENTWEQRGEPWYSKCKISNCRLFLIKWTRFSISYCFYEIVTLVSRVGSEKTK